MRQFISKLKKTHIKGKIFCAHKLKVLIFLKCPHYPNQSKNLIVIAIKTIIETERKQYYNLYGTPKNTNSKEFLRRTKLEAPHSLISKYVTKLQ